MLRPLVITVLLLLAMAAAPGCTRPHEKSLARHTYGNGDGKIAIRTQASTPSLHLLGMPQPAANSRH